MIKAIALVRTSTTHQEIEQQKREVLEMCTADGLSLDEVEIVGGRGLSAIKMDDEYMANINKVYSLINNNPSIKCVYAWAIDRIGRKDLLLTYFRCFLVEHKVQLKIRAQNLTLLNPDGTENFSVKIQFNLYATLAECEMQNKQARMLRGRYKNKEQGRFNGGRFVKYGYKIDEHGYYQVCEEEAEVIRLIFQLLNDSDKRMTLRKTTAELQNRGITIRGKKLPFRTVANISRDKVYIGGDGEKKMPRIVSDELFEAVGRRLSENIMVAPKSRRHHYYGTRIIKCANCGYYMSPSNDVYRCNAHVNTIVGLRNMRGDCFDPVHLGINYVDGALWEAAKAEYFYYIRQDNAAWKEKLANEKSVLEQKIKEAESIVSKADEKKKRVAKIYVDGIISEGQYHTQIAAVMKETEAVNATITSYNEEIKEIDRQLSAKAQEENLDALSIIQATRPLTERDDEKICEIVHRFIKSMTATRICTANNVRTVIEDYDLSRQNGFWFDIEAFSGQHYYFIYLNNIKKAGGFRLFEFDPATGRIFTRQSKQIIDMIRGKEVKLNAR